MSLKSLLLTAAIPASLLALSTPAMAQTACPAEITTEESRQVRTSNENAGEACDVTIAVGGNVSVTSGSAITIDSDNSVSLAGGITIGNDDPETPVAPSNNSTGIELQGGNSGDLNVIGSITIADGYTVDDTDNDNEFDGPFAAGSGQTGILISGAATSPFTGSVTTSGGITVQGNDSSAIRLANGAGFTGNLNLGGAMSVIGINARGIKLDGTLDGDLINSASITTQGPGASAIEVSSDVSGEIRNSGTIVNTGYRVLTGSNGTVANVRAFDALGTQDAEDKEQGAAAISIAANITDGVHLTAGSVTQYGPAPAILFDGDGNGITIGVVSEIIDETETSLGYAFVNSGTVVSNGVYNDVTATTLEVTDATLSGGINNTSSGNLQSLTYRSGNDGTSALTGEARVIVLGNAAMVAEINNQGSIIALAQEDANVYTDLNNIVGARSISAIAIDVTEDSTLSAIANSGVISAQVLGRDGTAIAIRDTTGSVTTIGNTGSINAVAAADAQNTGTTNFTTIALDLSTNTSGVTITQSQVTDATAPSIIGDILLGSGADSLTVDAGTISGDLAFGEGADVFTLSGGSIFSGMLSDSDEQVTISVMGGSTFTQNTAAPINATSASFDGTSIFSPTIDGLAGTASTLMASGNITFAEGASIAPVLSSVVTPGNNTFEIFNAGGVLSVGGDIDSSLLASDSPFLYDTSFALDPNDPNILLITLDVRPSAVLGLDPVQAASFDTSYAALENNSDLAAAFINITDGNEFRSALNQLLPEFAAAARQFVVANVDGAVGAVGTHLDNARLSQDQSGGAWIQEFTYFADRDLAGLSEQYRGFGFGFTGGLDTAFGPFHTAGVNFGFASTEIEDVLGFDEPMDVMTFQTGLYGGMQTGNLNVDIYGGGGFNDFEQTRNIQIGNFSDTANGDWSGTHLNGTIRGGYDVALSERFWARPSFSVDYLRLKENAYTETGTEGVALDVSGRTSELAGATAMINLGAKFEGKRTWVRPSIRAGYRNEFVNDGVSTTYGFAGLPNRTTLVSEVFPEEGFLLGFSLAAGSGYSSFGFDFDSDIRDGFIRHTGRIVLRMIF